MQDKSMMRVLIYRKYMGSYRREYITEMTEREVSEHNSRDKFIVFALPEDNPNGINYPLTIKKKPSLKSTAEGGEKN